jgi:NADH:ubiquinone oxidoreductase, NADH-binding (51 kD) subunit
MNRGEAALLKRIGRMLDVTDISEYERLGGFEGLKKTVEIGREELIHEIDIAKLRGRGGAAFPMGIKWRHLYESSTYPKYVVCNADEGEPGTFKDKFLLKEDPLAIIEGMIIAGYVFNSKSSFIYIRGEYRYIHSVFQKALDNAKRAGYLGKNIIGIDGFDYEIYLVSGGGAYVCGENSALLNSIEGKTGRPRVKPPHLADVGLFLKPTLVNNVESFACVPHIAINGGQNFLDMGTPDGGGTKLICLSGHIKNPGTYEINLGTPLEELLYSEKYGGGSSNGKPIKFIHFGGQSGPIGFMKNLEGTIYSYEGLWDKNLSVGSGAIVVMDDSVSIVEYLENVMEFFVHESCGKCTPCRLGTKRVLEMIETFVRHEAAEGDIERLEDALTHITNLSACGLGQSISVSIRSGLKQAREEFEECLTSYRKEA